jgi:hypothetical protein
MILVAISIVTLLPSQVALASTRDRLLSLVPADAISVGMIHVEDMRRSPTAQTIFAKMSAGGLDVEADRLLREAGLKPTEDVDLIMVSLSPASSSNLPRILVAASGRFDPVRLGNAVESRGGMRKSGPGATYFLAPEAEGEQPAICFYDRNLVLAGTEEAVVGTIQAMRRGQSAFARSRLGRELFRIDPRASGWMLFDMQRAQALRNLKAPGASPFGDQAYSAMKNISTISLWVAETSQGVEFGSAALVADAETRALLEDVLKGLLSSLRLAAQEKEPAIVKIVRRFKVTSSADAVTLTGSVPSALVNAVVAAVE